MASIRGSDPTWQISSQGHRRLIANAFAHLERHDLRAAIIEGVAAWEMIMSAEAPARLAEVHITYAEQDWKNLIEKAGLRASTALLVSLASHLPIVAKHRESLLESIIMRNTVTCANSSIRSRPVASTPLARLRDEPARSNQRTK